MRTAITIGRKRNGAWETIHLPDTPIPDQIKTVKAFQASGESVKYDTVELWESDAGVTKRARLKFVPPTIQEPTQPKPDAPAQKKVKQ